MAEEARAAVFDSELSGQGASGASKPAAWRRPSERPVPSALIEMGLSDPRVAAYLAAVRREAEQVHRSCRVDGQAP